MDYLRLQADNPWYNYYLFTGIITAHSKVHVPELAAPGIVIFIMLTLTVFLSLSRVQIHRNYKTSKAILVFSDFSLLKYLIKLIYTKVTVVYVSVYKNFITFTNFQKVM